MVRVSNLIITFLNCVTLAVSLVAIGFSIWLRFEGSATLCQKVFQKPLLILGISLLIVSVLGLIGSCCRSMWLMLKIGRRLRVVWLIPNIVNVYLLRKALTSTNIASLLLSRVAVSHPLTAA
uniref:Tetraspanin-5-like n=1 Tax=Nicotiana sylvestris TaxID=4096 RepID=A0A1U7V1E3_NICSY|nr:PREDICTED: tetraspanin-5-like [Nicotiana sylvestris]